MTKQALFAPSLGWPLLPLPDEYGRINYPTLEESVRQSIEVILSTRPGEQLMHPEFGAGLSNFLAQPNTLPTRAGIRDAVQSSLSRWEDRIVVDRIEVMEVPASPSYVRVEIAYRLRRTGQPLQLGLTMDLGA